MTIKRFILLACILAWFGKDGTAQSSTCSINGSFSSATNGSTKDNRLNTTGACINWRLTYQSTGFSALSISIQGAPDSSGTAGTFADITGSTIVTQGSNPSTLLQGEVQVQQFFPWMRVKVNSTTGSGTITYNLNGVNATVALQRPSGGTPGAVTQAYQTIQDEAVSLTQRSTVNFTGAGVSCADDAGNTRTNCTIGGSSGLAVDGYYLKSGSTYYIGPTNLPATLPSAGTYSWVNQGSATETASGNALTLSSPPTTSNSIHARTVAIGGATSLTVAMICTGTPVNFTTCGIGFRESATGKLTTMQMPVYGVTEPLNSVVDWTNPTTYGGTTPFTGGSLPCGMPWGRLLFGMTTITYQMSCDGVNFVTLVTENKNAFFTTAPDQWHYYVDSATATGVTNALLLSWSAL